MQCVEGERSDHVTGRTCVCGMSVYMYMYVEEACVRETV